ncbi:hypothetical protein CspeluHIS016_0206650 [Cutaneotrichosporon spelunceum]|uniref:Uncharacterized protein n=1 Tax=Cutaneotrichosporon spelunceum TaxID=1672016 RepID=A0AAD3TS36_9TREE|nr:hypothetical protein CspeluHIS016_0206650 [Cutaneotrichosporon spelunceum]
MDTVSISYGPFEPFSPDEEVLARSSSVTTCPHANPSATNHVLGPAPGATAYSGRQVFVHCTMHHTEDLIAPHRVSLIVV